MNENPSTHSTGSGQGNFWLGFFIGGFIGVVIIVLLGSKGEELLAEAQEVKEKAVEKIEEKKEVMGEVIVEKMDQVLTNIESAQAKGMELTQEVHHRYFKKDGKPLIS